MDFCRRRSSETKEDLASEIDMATFAGTTQKCKTCEKTVYLVDQLQADSKVYHKSCFRCHHCRGTLKVHDDILMIFVLSVRIFYICSLALVVLCLGHSWKWHDLLFGYLDVVHLYLQLSCSLDSMILFSDTRVFCRWLVLEYESYSFCWFDWLYMLSRNLS